MTSRSRVPDLSEPRRPDGAGGRPAGERAACWPRSLAAEGQAETLADWWSESTRQALAAGRPGFAHGPLSRRIADCLYEARRARRLVRGLEGAQSALAGQEAGLRRAEAARSPSGEPRISRLLVVSADGSERFYREVEKLRRRFAQRLEVLVLECDEAALGERVFGGGRRARAMLVDHKQAVAALGLALCEQASAPDSQASD